MNNILVKICGITNLEDAQESVRCGADALGFIFAKESPRFIAPEVACEIIKQMPEHITKVGVFVSATRRDIDNIIRVAQLSAIQLHGEQHPEDCTGFDVSVIKAFRVGGTFDVAQITRYEVDAFLLDTLRHGKAGGTGEVFDWNIAVRARSMGKMFLSGGLNPKNIEDAIRFVRPYAVDVSSGVESHHGKKDFKKLKEFITRAKSTTI